MRICYFIQTYKNSSQISRLVHTLHQANPNALIVISHAVEGCVLEEKLWQLPNVHVLNVQGGRGSFNITQNFLDAIDWLLSNQFEFDWFINLTGQDYPIQPVEQIEQTLQSTEYDGFLEYFKVFSSESHWTIAEGKTRYCYRYRSLGVIPDWQKSLLKPLKIVNYLQSFFRINFAYDVVVGLRAATPFNQDFICYGGSYFCTLSRKCVEYLHQFIQQNPDLLEYFRGATVPDEILIQTVLLNSHQFNLANDWKRYVDFSGSQNGRPRLLGTSDYPVLAQQSGFFARKFDSAYDSNILDLLDAKIQASNDIQRLSVATD